MAVPCPRRFALRGSLSRSTLKRLTSDRNFVDIAARLLAAFCESVAPCDVLCAACATPCMFCATSPAPRAASATQRDISLVVADCSSTAVAIVPEMLFT
jgi:hypothetical protein